jgi:hypothetical protein
LNVQDDFRAPVQHVHNLAARRITADSDWDTAERRDVYVAPCALERP